MSAGHSTARAYPAALVLGAVASVQSGAALATRLFDDLGPAGTVLLRTLFAALLLAAIWRPTLGGHPARHLRAAAVFGASLAGMNLCFYEGLDRLPLGVAVTLEFVGPLGVALIGSRTRLDLVWAALAGLGIVLLWGGAGGGGVDALGAVLVIVAGVFWGAYILIAGRVGRIFPGGSGLALAMAFSTLLVLPAGLAGGGSSLLDPRLAAIGLAVAVLSSVIPYSLELEALRRLPAGVFGVLMSLEPAIAALIGFLALGQQLSSREVVAVALVVTASAGALRSGAGPPPLEQ
ncbi:MAG: EamA family transporter [Solirubrobacterales bacterium]